MAIELKQTEYSIQVVLRFFLGEVSMVSLNGETLLSAASRDCAPPRPRFFTRVASGTVFSRGSSDKNKAF
jgi:hypothetical protein